MVIAYNFCGLGSQNTFETTMATSGNSPGSVRVDQDDRDFQNMSPAEQMEELDRMQTLLDRTRRHVVESNVLQQVAGERGQ